MVLVISSPSDVRPLLLSNYSAPCRGGSMRSTLAEGDRLWISPVSFDGLQPGDVVAFHSGGKVMAHRVVRRCGDGLQTQGDGNWRPDAALLKPDQLIGMVIERERRGVRTPVKGGVGGRRRATLLHGFSWFRWVILTLLAPGYRWIQASRIPRRLWRPRITTARFTTREGDITKLIHRGKTVATWIPEAGEWTCRKPYDLVLSPPSR